MFAESKQLESDLQTLVYQNYTRFVDASEAVSGLNTELGDLEEDLAALGQSVANCEARYDKVHSMLGPKWTEISKLSALERDLSKLKFLSELPQQFKGALAAFCGDLQVFVEPVLCYRDYADVLHGYKGTKFMVSLYGEIKSYVARIRLLVLKAMDALAASSKDQFQAGLVEEHERACLLLKICGEDGKALRQTMLKVHLSQLAHAGPNPAFVTSCMEAFVRVFGQQDSAHQAHMDALASSYLSERK